VLVTAKGIKSTNAQLAGVDAAARKAGGGATAMGSRFAKAAKVAAAALLVTLGVGLHAAISKGMEFERQMSSLGAVTEATAKQQGRLEKQALRLGEATQYSASETAEAQIELAKGGLKTKEIIGGALPAALSLAAAGQLELADAATATVNAMKLFGLSGKESVMIADLYATAANTTTADVGDFAMAMTAGGSAAKQAGLDINETVVILEALAEAGIKNSDAGTSLKTSFIQLLAPSTKQKKLAGELGLVWTKQNGTLKSGVEISRELHRVTDEMTKAERLKVEATLAGTDGFRTLAALYDAGPAKLERMTRANLKQGTAQEVAAKKMDNLKGDVEQLEGAFETLEIQLMHGSAPALREITQDATDLVTQINGIVSNEGLTGEQKVDRIFNVLAGAASDALTKITEEAAQYGPRFIQAFGHGMLEGWNQMSPLARIFSVAALLKAVGGKGALLSSGGLIGRFLGIGVSTSAATTIAGKGGGKGGVVGALGAIKWGRVGALGLGVALADATVEEFSREANMKSDDLSKALNAMGGPRPFGVDFFGGAEKLPVVGGLFSGALKDSEKAARNVSAQYDELLEKRVRISAATEKTLRAEVEELDLTKSQKAQLEQMFEVIRGGRNLGIKVDLGDLGRVKNISAYLKNFDLLKSGVITRMKDISKISQESLEHINASYKAGTPKWRAAVIDSMQAQVAAIKAGMKSGVIETEAGQDRIRDLMRNMHLVKGDDWLGLAKGFASSWAKAGSVTEGQIQKQIKQLRKLPPGAQEQARNAMVRMARAMESEGKLVEGSASRLNSALTATFGKTKTQIEHSVAMAMANVAASVEDGATNVGGALGSIQKQLGHALEALGSSKIPGLVLSAASQYHHAREATMSGFETGGFVVAGRGEGDRPFPGGLEVGSFVMNKTATAALGFAGGGRVPVELEPGELVLGPREVRAHGLGNLEAMNRAVRRKDGGPIGTPQFSGPTGPVREIAQLSAVKVAAAANAYYDQHMPQGGPGYSGPPIGPAGTSTYMGVLMATWVKQALEYAAAHGSGNPQPTSGYRSHAYNVAQGRDYYSEHEKTQYPGGAVDFGGFTTGLAQKMAVVNATRGFRYPLLAPIGFRDDGHASGTGHMLGGLIRRLASGGTVLGIAGPILARNGLDLVSGAGVMGNSYGESNWNTEAIEPGTDNGGLFGFTTGEKSKAALEGYAKAHGHSWTDTATQVKFMLSTLPAGMREAMNRMSKVDETTSYFMHNWERPENYSSLGTRISAAHRAVQYFKNHGYKNADEADEHSFKEDVPKLFHGLHTDSLHFPSTPKNVKGLDREIDRWKEELGKYHRVAGAARRADKPKVEQALQHNATDIAKQLRELRHEKTKLKRKIARERFTTGVQRRLATLTGFEPAIEEAQRRYEELGQTAGQAVDLEPLQPELPREPQLPDTATAKQVADAHNTYERERQASEEGYVSTLTAYIEGTERPAYLHTLDAAGAWRNTILDAQAAAAGPWQKQNFLGGLEGGFEDRIITLVQNEEAIEEFIQQVNERVSDWRSSRHDDGDKDKRQGDDKGKGKGQGKSGGGQISEAATVGMPADLAHQIETRDRLLEKLPELRFRENQLRETLGEGRGYFYPGKVGRGVRGVENIYHLRSKPPVPAIGSGTFEDDLRDVQGIHWPGQHDKLGSLPVTPSLGQFGGAIWETQTAISELGLRIKEAGASVQPADIETPGPEEDATTSQLLEATQQLLRESNTRNAVAEAQGAAIDRWRTERADLNSGSSAFAGFFAGGGSIPAGKWGVTGEKGPEPVFGPARVFSNQEGREMFGGGGETSIQVIVKGDIAPAPGVNPDEVIEVLESHPRSKDVIRRTVLGGRGTGRATPGDWA
jgi:TP901 family phage tail tape measure protein